MRVREVDAHEADQQYCSENTRLFGIQMEQDWN